MAFNINQFSDEPNSGKSGRVIAVDPNSLRDVDEKVFQPQENYNIIAELSTYRKRKTKIVRDDGEFFLRSTPNDEEGSVVINFIEGTDVGGENRLTTHYTELRTKFEEEQGDLETLGITNIDIQFNTSFAPLITINFVDIRARLFEQGSESKYNVFFNLPYPVFKLTLKGFYGPPITYCLHLTKFKSKFNSDTGNMEITTNFVGYTYAFLADMLMGYVRAIGETEIGQEKLAQKSLSKGFRISPREGEAMYDERKRNNKIPITINDLLRRVDKINSFVESIKENDEQLREFVASNSVIDEINTIRNDDVESFIEDIDGIEGDSNVERINDVLFIPSKKTSQEVNSEGNLRLEENSESIEEINEKFEDFIDTYITNDEAALNSKLDSKYEINFDDVILFFNDGVKTIKSRLNSEENSQNHIKQAMVEYFSVSKFKDVPDIESSIVIIDIKTVKDRLKNLLTDLREDSRSSAKQISKRLVNEIEDDDLLGFKPTIANIIEIFTHNVEAFIQSIKKVHDNVMNKVTVEVDSEEENNENESTPKGSGRIKEERGDEDFDNNISISSKGDKGKVVDTIGDIRSDNGFKNVLPFPEYREKDQDVDSNHHGQYKEAWIGKVAPDIREVSFTENIIDGLIETRKKDKNRADNMRDKEKTWYPVHPFDVKGVLHNENPYSLANFTTKDQILDLIIGRALIFLFQYPGTSFKAGDNEVKVMGRLEANNLYNAIKDDRKLKFAIKRTTLDEFEEKIINTFFEFIDDNVTSLRVGDLVLTYGSDNHFFKFYTNPKFIKRGENDNILSELNNFTVFDVGSDLKEGIKNNGKVLPNNEREGKYSGYRSLITDEGDKGGFLGNLNDTLDFVNFGNNILSDEVLLRSNSFAKTKFSNRLGFTDYTKIKPVDDVTGVDAMPTRIMFYERDTFSTPFLRNKEREKSYGDIVQEKSTKDLSGSEKERERFESVLPGTAMLTELGFDDGDNEIDIGLNEGHYLSSIGGGKLPIVSFLGFSTLGKVDTGEGKINYNIFGTHLYYAQNEIGDSNDRNKAKAFLFLNSIPFRGFTFPTEEESEEIADEGKGAFARPIGLGSGVFGNKHLSALFKGRASFVSVPYSWVLFIGSLLWRYENDVVKFFGKTSNGEKYSLFPPEWLTSEGDDFENVPNNSILNTVIQLEGVSIWDRFFANVGITSFIFGPGGGGLLLTEQAVGELFASYSSNPRFIEGEAQAELSKSPYTSNALDDLLKLDDNIREKFKSEFEKWATTPNGEWENIRSEFEIFEEDATTVDIGKFWLDLFKDNSPSKRDLDVVKGNGSVSHDKVRFDVLESAYANSKDFIEGFITANDEEVIPNIYSIYSVHSLNVIEEEIDNGSLLENNGVNDVSNVEDIMASKNFSLFNFFLEFTHERNKNANQLLSNFIDQEMVIINPSPTTFVPGNPKHSAIEGDVQNISINYFTEFKEEYNNLFDDEQSNRSVENQEIKRELFKSVDSEDIKLSVYKDIKNINDKWVAGTDNPLSVCGPNYATDSNEDSLFNSFRFLDRSFHDISNNLLINPANVQNYMQEDLNRSFYDFLSRMLSDNNMDFIPLPNFIEFTKSDDLKKVFTPQTFMDRNPFEAAGTGPTFVCMYIGERANSLDLGDDSDYEDKGFDIQLTEDGNVTADPSIEDFMTNPPEGVEANRVPIFMVNYGDQNQSIFKNFTLDQSEFSETNESLYVQDQISQRGAPTSKNMQGQNLYSVYEKRAYHCEIEALGAPYIQPMMYFQLNNVPMYHGVYIIINVEHSLEPHYMETKFKGVRVGRIRTPFVSKETVFMNLIGSLSDLELDDDVEVGSDLINAGTLDEGIDNPGDDEDIGSVDPIDEILMSDILDRGDSGPNIVITSDYGVRNGDPHEGLDLRAEVGTPIKPPHDDMTVELIRLRDGFGLHLVLRKEFETENSTFRMRYLYAHLSDISDNIKDINNLNDTEKTLLTSDGIQLNESVNKDTILGETGGGSDNVSTRRIKGVSFAGSSGAPHLHFEIRKENQDFHPNRVLAYYKNSVLVNPYPLIEASDEATDPQWSTEQRINHETDRSNLT